MRAASLSQPRTALQVPAPPRFGFGSALLTAAAFRAQNQMVPELAASKKALVQRLRTTKVRRRLPAPLPARREPFGRSAF